MKPNSGENTPTIHVDLKQAIYALSDALDLVGIDEIQHGKRVGYMTRQVAEHIGWKNQDLHDLFETSLLHDCGVSSSVVHNHLVEEFDWEGSEIHCEMGYELLKEFPLMDYMAIPILYHHTHWNKLKDIDISEKDKFKANLIYLIDRVDVIAAHHLHRDILAKKNEIRHFIEKKSGEFFMPELVEAFLEVSENHAFWLSLQPSHMGYFMEEMGKSSVPVEMSLSDLKQIASMFSRIVDAKSAFTVEHSIAVAKISVFMAEKLNLPPLKVQKIEIAALLHDLGKLRIPDEILEKATPLDQNEVAIIEQHSFETFEILKRIKGVEDIAHWAAQHHEKLDGSGYPFQKKKQNIDLEARIIAISDIFQALAQKRPYRNSLKLEHILRIMNSMTTKGTIDPDLMALINRYPDQFFTLSHTNREE